MSRAKEITLCAVLFLACFLIAYYGVRLLAGIK